MRSGLHGGGGGGGHRRRRGCWRRLILLLLLLGRLLLLPLLPLPVLHLENFQLESPLSRCRGGGSAGSRSHGGAGSALGVVVTRAGARVRCTQTGRRRRTRDICGGGL